jgi:hypothetical protein
MNHTIRVRRKLAAIKNRLETRRNNVVLDGDSMREVFRGEEILPELFEHVGQPLVERETFTEFAQFGIGRSISRESSKTFM